MESDVSVRRVVPNGPMPLCAAARQRSRSASGAQGRHKCVRTVSRTAACSAVWCRHFGHARKMRIDDRPLVRGRFPVDIRGEERVDLAATRHRCSL